MEQSSPTAGSVAIGEDVRARRRALGMGFGVAPQAWSSPTPRNTSQPGADPGRPRCCWPSSRCSEVLEAAGVIDPVALAGVQDKASARMLSLPVGRAGRRFILTVDRGSTRTSW